MSFEARDETLEAFYAVHRGGSGAVILVTAISPEREEIHGIFSSREAANAWIIGTIPDHWVITFAPYVVDEPGWADTRQ